MPRLAPSVLALVLLSALPGLAEVRDNVNFEGNTYFYLSGDDFDALEAEAVSLGGRLASINSQEENDFVAQWLGPDRRPCIGLTDREEEGTFVWISGEPVVFTNWAPGFPDEAAGGGDFVRISPDNGNGLWFDQPECFGQGLAKAPVRPRLSSGSVLNTASFLQDGLPGSGIAQGAMFAVFGSDMGPQTLQQAGALPLPTELGGTSVQATVAGVTVDCFLIFTSSGQLAAVLPSNTPLGEGTLTVTYEGEMSEPAPITVARSRFGIFTRNQGGFGPAIVQNFVSATEAPVNSFIQAAAPGQVGILWGTGLGPIDGDDSGLPPVGDLPVDVMVLVGGRVAQHFYAGRSPQFPAIDQINFFVPEGIEGCYVPIAVKVDDVVSNYGSIAISSEGKYCEDDFNFSAEALQTAEQNGELRLGQITIERFELTQREQEEPSQEMPEVDVDADGLFWRASLPNLLASLGPQALPVPPAGTCTVFGTDDPEDPIVENLATFLDAGPAINISGPTGMLQLPRRSDGNFYDAELNPADIVPGVYSAENGDGGQDIGAIRAQLTIPSLLSFTNMDSLVTIPRASDLTVTWSGGDPNNGFVAIAGISGNGAAGFFLCVEQAAAGTFTVPSSTVLSSLPAFDPDESDGLLIVVSVPSREASQFTAPGLDLGLFVYLENIGSQVLFE